MFYNHLIFSMVTLSLRILLKYCVSYGETVDLEVAYKFYQEAAELGCKEAEEVLGEGYFYSSLYGK